MVLAVAGCSDTGESEILAQERIERTASALESFLVPQAALDEARRLVSMCDTLPDEMFYQRNRYKDPDGPEIFATLQDAERLLLRRRGATLVPVDELACNEAELRYVDDLSNT